MEAEVSRIGAQSSPDDAQLYILSHNRLTTQSTVCSSDIVCGEAVLFRIFYFVHVSFKIVHTCVLFFWLIWLSLLLHWSFFFVSHYVGWLVGQEHRRKGENAKLGVAKKKAYLAAAVWMHGLSRKSKRKKTRRRQSWVWQYEGTWIETGPPVYMNVSGFWAAAP